MGTMRKAAEVCGLRRSEVDQETGTLTVQRRCGMNVELRRTGYIFAADPTGRSAWRPDTANARWVRARNAADLPSVRLHDLRHFQATQLLDAGVPVPTVAARLGHTDGTTTMKIYAHRTRRADELAAGVVGKLLDDIDTPMRNQ